MSLPALDQSVLDNPAWASLRGAHRHLAQTYGRTARYPADVAPFHALADPADPAAWADLAALVGPGAEISLAGAPLEAFPGWAVLGSVSGVQFIDESLAAADDAEAVVLTTTPRRWC